MGAEPSAYEQGFMAGVTAAAKLLMDRAEHWRENAASLPLNQPAYWSPRAHTLAMMMECSGLSGDVEKMQPNGLSREVGEE